MTEIDGAARAARWQTTAMQIAQDLSVQAVWADGLCAFQGATPPESLRHPPRFRSTGGDLYEGSAGVARFLGIASLVSGEAALRTTALGAVRHALARVEGWPLFTGGMGAGLVALELGEWLDAPDLVTPGIRLIERASLAADAERAPYDLLVGTAGVIVGLVAAREYDVDGGWTQRALDLGRSLLAAAVPEGLEDPDGPPLSWPLAPAAPDRLCGLAHGASGIALAFEALVQLAGASSDASTWRSAARRARCWERAHYSAAEGSWADLRRPEGGIPEGAPGFPHMWCHGSIGVGAERLGALDHDPLARADAVGALAGARRQADRIVAGPVGPGGDGALNGSLCHGIGGLIDLFVDAWRTTEDTGWMALAGSLADTMINDGRRPQGWRSGIPGGAPAPGLMLGSAGIGWALLRVAQPDRVPSGWRIGPRWDTAAPDIRGMRSISSRG